MTSSTHYSPEFLQAQQGALQTQRQSVIDELATIATFDAAAGTYVALQPVYDEGSVEDSIDSGTEAEELHERSARVRDLEKTLAEVDRALDKLKHGTYGRCEVTGDWIAEDRLRAYPAARTCLPDQTAS